MTSTFPQKLSCTLGPMRKSFSSNGTINGHLDVDNNNHGQQNYSLLNGVKSSNGHVQPENHSNGHATVRDDRSSNPQPNIHVPHFFGKAYDSSSEDEDSDDSVLPVDYDPKLIEEEELALPRNYSEISSFHMEDIINNNDRRDFITKCEGIVTISQSNTSTMGEIPDSSSKFTATKPLDEKTKIPESKQSDIESHEEKFEQPFILLPIFAYLCFMIPVVFGYLRDFMRNFNLDKQPKGASESAKQKDFVPLFSHFEAMYTRNCLRRIRDGLSRPICSVPGHEVEVMERITRDSGWTFELTGKSIKCINLSSYNYLGFAQKDGPCAEATVKSINKYGIAPCGSRHEFGNLAIHKELETLVAQYLRVEAAMCFPTGFSTNAMNIPCFAEKGCLILSDELNHASAILGCRLSGAQIRVFKHNNIQDLEQKLRDAVVYGQSRTHKVWKKILIVVEGIYSMEGSIVHLPEIIALKKKYKAYLFLDEAHSIGALGSHGGGVIDYYNCNPKDVDIIMGTFSKSFGSCGGYIAGSAKLINHLHKSSHSACYGGSLSTPVCQQIISSMSIMMGKDGSNEGQRRIQQLMRNSKYLRARLKQLGFIIFGDEASPVVPLMSYLPSKCSWLVRETLRRGVAVVTVGFPATAISAARARFCVSAAHTKEQLDYALDVLDEAGDKVHLKHSSIKYRVVVEILAFKIGHIEVIHERFAVLKKIEEYGLLVWERYLSDYGIVNY